MDSLLASYAWGGFGFHFPYPKLKSLCASSAHHNPYSKKAKRSFIRVKYSNPEIPNSKWRICCSNIKSPASIFVPIVKKMKAFAVNASEKNWVSVLYSSPGNGLKGQCLQSGAFGIALLSVTTTAKVKISPIVATLAGNPTFVSGLFAGAIAQSIKVLLNLWVERKWDLKLFFTSGGMPSSHSALCTALTTSVALCHGLADSLFPVCLGFSSIVMYDAIGVRRHAGMQAEVLNVIIQDLFKGHPISQRKLKELLGHTPSQVIAGALLGIIVACFCCQSCLISC